MWLDMNTWDARASSWTNLWSCCGFNTLLTSLYLCSLSPIPPLGFWLCHTSPPRERLPLVPDCHTMPPRERLPLGSWLCLKKTRAAFSLLSRVLLTREDWNYRKKKWKAKDTPRAQRDLVPKALSVLLGPFICSVNRSRSSKIALPF